MISSSSPDRSIQDTQAAAQSLVDDGAVTNLRLMPANGVVTGVVTGNYRVYLRRATNDPTQLLEAECSCGQPVPCVHAGAVLLAAATQTSAPQAAIRHSATATAAPISNTSDLQQQLRYVLQPASNAAIYRQLQLSIWIDQQATTPDTAHAFVPRTSGGGHGYPRYVNELDRQILQTLTTQNSDGPWLLAADALPQFDQLLDQIIRTGRASWQALGNPPLRPGSTRMAGIRWEVHGDGRQTLSCTTSPPATILVTADDIRYIDANTGDCGQLSLPCPPEIPRHFWAKDAIAPEDVLQALDFIQSSSAHAASSAAFPLPQLLTVEREPRRGLQPRLMLAAGPEARLQFIYNGLECIAAHIKAAIGHPPNRSSIAGQSLEQSNRALIGHPMSLKAAIGHPSNRGATAGQNFSSANQGQATMYVRILHGGVVHEIPRDTQAEQTARDLLGQQLPHKTAGSDAWLKFMLNAVPLLLDHGWDVQTALDFPYTLATPGEWYVHADADDSWFDVKLGMQVDDEQVNLLPALVDYLQGLVGTGLSDCRRIGEHLMVRLKDQRYLPVPIQRLQQVADTLIELFDHDSLTQSQALRLHRSHATRLAQIVDELPRPRFQTSDAAFTAAVAELRQHCTPQPHFAPADFQAQLRGYQREGLGWLQHLRRCRLGGVLADDMGLGKTVQTLAHLALEHEQGRLQRPSLIVAPVSVIGNWKREIQRLAPKLKVFTLHGPRRHEYFAAIPQAHIIITSYPLLPIDSEVLSAHHFYYVVLDEAQTIKNPRAQVSQAARALNAEHRLCLTGTPMENHLGELWSLLDFVQPGILGDEREFQRRYRQPIERARSEVRAKALSQRIAPFVLRRTKDAVAPDLPPKTQIIETIELDERQRDFYESVRLASHRRVHESIEQNGLARSQITVLDALLKLRQACCDPRLLADQDGPPVPSAKLQWLAQVLPEMVEQGRRILLFSQFTSMLSLIESQVRELGIKYQLLTGQTRDRTERVDAFQRGDVPLFLISLKAGGTGLNLTRADTVIHYDPWWNPAAEAQATDRAHRIGQHRPVFVYKLIAQDTVEERIIKLQEHKQLLASQLYAATHGNALQLGAAELEMLLAP